MKRYPTFGWLLACMALSWFAPLAGAKPSVEFDRWYQILMQDQAVGWQHATVLRDEAAGRWESLTQVHLTIRRGPVNMTIEVSTRFIEDTQGKPLEASVVQKLGTMDMTQKMRFNSEGIEVTSLQAGQEQKQSYPDPARNGQPWLPPAAAQRYVEEQLARDAKTIAFQTLDPSIGPRAFEVKMTYVGPENVQVLGKVAPAQVWDTAVSAMPGLVTKTYLDDQGQLLRTTTPLMGMTLTILEADEALAKSPIQPVEMLVSLMIELDKPLPQPRSLRRAMYELELAPPVGSDPHAVPSRVEAPALPGTGVQRIIPAQANRPLRVLVDLDHPAPPSRLSREEAQAALAAPPMLNHRDPAIRTLLTQALAKVQGEAPARQAQALRRFVYEYVESKELSVGLATASEVARTRQGDCTEHAMLLAALLRAAGIPSRVASGLVYVDQFMGRQSVMGYHMWTQAWLPEDRPAPATATTHPQILPGRWVDLDPSLDPDQPFDATHIALGLSALDEGEMSNDMVKMVPLFGRLRLRVIEPAGR